MCDFKCFEMFGRGEKLLSLDTPQPKKPPPRSLHPRRPLSELNVQEHLSFRDKMKNTQRFLDSLHSPQQLRREIDQTADDNDKEASRSDFFLPEVEENSEQELENEVHKAASPEKVIENGAQTSLENRVAFVSFGFMRLSSNDDDVDGSAADPGADAVPLADHEIGVPLTKKI